MAVLEHPNIVAVHQVFEENNTAYMALSEVKGVDLATLVEDKTGPISNDLLRKVTQQSLDVFEFIHQNGVLHRDIAPDNLMMDDGGHVTLIDFGASRQAEGKNEAGLYAVKDGYSPPELYVANALHSFATDVYALGATLHYLATGMAPPDSVSRLRALKDRQPDPYVPLARRGLPFDREILSAIDHALSVPQKRRFQSVAEWRAAIEVNTPAAQGQANPDLETEIRLMVESINTQMADDIKAPEPQQDQAAPSDQTDEKRVVDIFGNPIEDVDAWLAHQEQDRAVEPQDNAAEPEQDEQVPAPQTSLLGSFISRCFSRKSCQTDQMTKT
jgi:serine/threonine protein kinase